MSPPSVRSKSIFRGGSPITPFSAKKMAQANRGPPPDAPPTWIIDPIDGTTNYVHDCPFYCISSACNRE